MATKDEEFARKYHSHDRVLFVKSLPCAACGLLGHSQNAHVLGPDGTSRKKGYETIAPLCGPIGFQRRVRQIGCHRLFDEHRSQFDRIFPTFNPEEAAADTQRRWLAYDAKERSF